MSYLNSTLNVQVIEAFQVKAIINAISNLCYWNLCLNVTKHEDQVGFLPKHTEEHKLD